MDGEMMKTIGQSLGPSGACVVVVWLFVRFLSSHMSENTKALNGMTSALGELKGVIVGWRGRGGETAEESDADRG